MWLWPDSLVATLAEARYAVYHDGTAVRTDANGQRKFTVPLPDTSLHIEILYIISYACDLLFIPQYTDVESGAASISRLSGRSLKPLWTAEPVGFNLAPPLLDDSFLYIAAIGTVAKLDLQSGSYVWRHDGLYERETGAFGIFELPEVIGDTVIFSSSSTHGPPLVRHLAIHSETGQFLTR